MASTTRLTLRGLTFEVIRYTPPAPTTPYYRVAVEDSSSPVGFSGYLERFTTKAKAVAFARRLAATYAIAGV